MVRFASEDLKNYREGHWLLLREDLEGFLTRPENDDRGAVAIPEKMPVLTNDEIQWIQSHVKDFLRGVVERPEPNERDGWILKPGVNAHFPLREITCSSWETLGRVTVRGGYKDCVLFVVASLLSDPQAQNIVSCPECRNVFMREGKQIFCSRRCTNRAMVKRKREKDSIKASRALTAKRFERLEQNTKQQKGQLRGKNRRKK